MFRGNATIALNSNFLRVGMKENYLNEIEKLNNRVSNLELIEAKYNRILTAMIEDSQEQMNLSDADLSMEKKKSEDGERDIYRIQSETKLS